MITDYAVMTRAQDHYTEEIGGGGGIIKYLMGGKNWSYRSSCETKCFREKLKRVTCSFNWRARDCVKYFK